MAKSVPHFLPARLLRNKEIEDRERETTNFTAERTSSQFKLVRHEFILRIKLSSTQRTVGESS